MLEAFNIFGSVLHIHPMTVSNDGGYEVAQLVIDKVKAKRDEVFEVVETPEMDISDCGVIDGDLKVKMILLKCSDRAWGDIQRELSKEAKKQGIPTAKMTIV